MRYLDVGRLQNDLNGDGYGDLAIGAAAQDAGASNEGNVFVYYASSAGWSASPNVTLDNLTNQADANFGHALGAGDLNADGFADLIVGSAYQENGAFDEGIVYVHLGSSAGVGTSPTVTIENPANQAGGAFGFTVSFVGDANGDGYGDLVAGAIRQDNGAIDEGNAVLFYGTAGGVPVVPSLVIDSPTNQAGAWFGISTGGVGDVNGDGHADFAVGAVYQAPGGAAYVFYGSPTGVSDIPATTIATPGDQANAQFGNAVVGADVTGDGYSDIVVGAYFYDAGATDEGGAFLYLGGSGGVTTPAAASLDNPTNESGARFGHRMGTGDINGDGVADVCIGATFQNGINLNEGRTFVFHGSSAGLSLMATISNPGVQSDSEFGNAATIVGDANGNGYSEVVAAASRYDSGATDEGSAFAYYGTSTGVSPSISATFDNPANQANGLFGWALLR